MRLLKIKIKNSVLKKTVRMLYRSKAIKQRKLNARNVETICAFNVLQLGIKIKRASRLKINCIKDGYIR